MRRYFDALINIIAVFLLGLAWTIWIPKLFSPDWPRAICSVPFYILLLVLFLLRKPTKEVDTNPIHFLIAMGGTFLPFAMRPDTPSDLLLFNLSWPLFFIGGTISVIALATLGRNFGVVAANRGIKTEGLYRFIRHPLYTGEAIWFLSLTLQNLSVYNMAVYVLQISCQILRMRAEEKLLAKEERYAAYMAQVRYRMLPGVF